MSNKKKNKAGLPKPTKESPAGANIAQDKPNLDAADHWPYKWGKVIAGDAYQLGKHIPDRSVSGIVTDPLYDDMAQYVWLAQFARRVLRPNGVLLVYCSIGWLPETLAALRLGGMHYVWELTSAWSGGSSRAQLGFCKQARLLWYDIGGTSRPHKKLVDLRVDPIGTSSLPDTGGVGSWSKMPDHLAYWMQGFFNADDLILDPFSGWGTTGALCKLLGIEKFTGFEIKAERAKQANAHITQCQKPLIPIAPAQGELLQKNQEGWGKFTALDMPAEENQGE
jgi:hypothetical protein